MANRKIIFPQSPMVDLQTGYLALEWFMWFQNPQFLSIVLGTPIDVVNGGTGLTSGTSGGILGFTGSTTLASSVELTQHAIVIGGGAGATPTPLGSLGTTTTVLHGNASGDPTFGSVSLTADITGTLGATHGGTGFASYAVGDILYADTTTTLAKLADVATKQVLVSGGVNTAPAWSPNLTLSGDLSIEGNTILGNASGDTYTNNAGTWTYGANWLATRAVGALAAGAQSVLQTNITFTGDSGGTSTARGFHVNTTASGSNPFTTLNNITSFITHSGSATASAMRSMNSSITLSSTGNITNSNIITGNYSLQSSGSITTAVHFNAETALFGSTGSITTFIGFRAQNFSNATLVTNAIGFDTEDMTGAVTLTAAFRSQMTSGTGKWGVYSSGTANNAFNGNVRIGSTTAPSVALDVTGSVAVSGNTTLGDADGDALTINAGTWTYGANWSATRAGGTVAAGTVNLTRDNYTATGDSGGTSDIRGRLSVLTISGGNNVAQAETAFILSQHSGTGTVATQYANLFSLGLTNSGSITSAVGSQGGLFITGAGNITSGFDFFASPPIFTSTGAITTLVGFGSGNLGHATLVTNAIGHDASDMTASVTLTAGFRSQVSSGTNKWGIYAVGTADNFFEGIIKIGATGSAANNAQTVTVGNVGPGAAGVSIQSWQKVKDSAGNTRYIPLFG